MKSNSRKNADTRIISSKVIRVEPTGISPSPSEYRNTVLNISEIISEGGYNPVSQIFGYILSEDPTHISNYKNARKIMSSIDRDTLLEDMVKYYLEVKSDE